MRRAAAFFPLCKTAAFRPPHKDFFMANDILHRRTRIVTLDAADSIATHCRPDDIALLQDDQGWWVHFIADDGASDTYDAPFKTYNEALWAAKAAAEFDSSL